MGPLGFNEILIILIIVLLLFGGKKIPELMLPRIMCAGKLKTGSMRKIKNQLLPHLNY
jgi:Sec-independent protein translocase protein TatA